MTKKFLEIGLNEGTLIWITLFAGFGVLVGEKIEEYLLVYSFSCLFLIFMKYLKTKRGTKK